MVKSSDAGKSVWYFVAPEKFLGNKRDAYGGVLYFRHGFFEYDSQGKDMMDGEFDVMLISAAQDLTVGRRAVIPPWDFSSEHRLQLDEMGGWLLSPSNTAPSRHDMVRLLSQLSGVWIRGGFYAGREDSYVMDVKLVAGPEEESSPKSSLKHQTLSEADSKLGMGAQPTSGGEGEAGGKGGGIFGKLFGGFGAGKDKEL